jgi:hypothetical protein
VPAERHLSPALRDGAGLTHQVHAGPDRGEAPACTLGSPDTGWAEPDHQRVAARRGTRSPIYTPPARDATGAGQLADYPSFDATCIVCHRKCSRNADPRGWYDSLNLKSA